MKLNISLNLIFKIKFYLKILDRGIFNCRTLTLVTGKFFLVQHISKIHKNWLENYLLIRNYVPAIFNCFLGIFHLKNSPVRRKLRGRKIVLEKSQVRFFVYQLLNCRVEIRSNSHLLPFQSNSWLHFLRKNYANVKWKKDCFERHDVNRRKSKNHCHFSILATRRRR